MAFSPDGLYFVFCAGDLVHLWETATRRRSGLLLGHTNPVTSITCCSATKFITIDGYKIVCHWDIGQLKRATAAPAEQSPSASAYFWNELKSLTPLQGLVATEYFQQHPQELLRWLNTGEHLPRKPSPVEIQKLIQRLGQSRFQQREQAMHALLALEDLGVKYLQEALDTEADAEVRGRLSGILDHILAADLGPHGHHLYRIIFLLERINTVASRDCLERIAGEAFTASIQYRAKNALLRGRSQRMNYIE